MNRMDASDQKIPQEDPRQDSQNQHRF